ncbi:MAG TPA: hypothetical protein DCY79_10295, partial [Planctomycetaceae bacterium]|nr:hypothetical protein [Planctomycetaceae bacterium]
VSGEMVASIRQGNGPGFLWCEVDRLGGHTSNDDHRQYRSEEELNQLDDSDPLARFKRRLLAEQIVSSSEIEQLERDVRRDVRADYEQAASEAAPQASETLLHVVGDSAIPNDCPVELSSEATIADAVKATFRAALAEDDRFVFFGEDIEDPKGGVFKITEGLSTEFPGRVVNSPLAESTIAGMACGLASYGKRPVFELQFIDFAASGWNQIVNNLATLRWRSNGKWSCPSVIYAPYGGYLPGGAIWHSQANESALAHFPGLTVAIPSTPEDTAGMFWTAMHGEDPVIILLPKHLLRKPQVTNNITPVELGKARVVRQGSDVTIVAWGNAVELAVQAAEQLDPEISADVIDLRSIVPWDREAVCESIEKTGRLVVVQEDTENCSVGQMVITDVLKDHAVWSKLLAPPQLVSKPNVLIGFHPNFEYAALPGTEQLVEAVKKTIGASPRREIAAAPLPSSTAPVAEAPPAPAPAPAPPTTTHTTTQPTAAPETDHVQVVVPHLGEGIYNCDVVQLLKQAGDTVESDEPLCEIETDKATLAIEASHAGILERWETVEGENLEVGQSIATIRLHGAPTKRCEMQPTSTNSIALTRAVQVPTASATAKIRWDVVKAACAQRESKGGRVSPTAVTAFHLAEAFNTEAGQRFLHRAMPSYETERYFDLGIAVALPGDELTTAVVENPLGLSWPDFLSQYDAAIESARRGDRHDRRRVALQLSTLGRLGIEDAHPLVVPPSAGTLFVGAAHWELIDIDGQPQPHRVASLVISFDHRLINGVGAASLLNELKAAIEAAA